MTGNRSATVARPVNGETGRGRSVWNLAKCRTPECGAELEVNAERVEAGQDENRNPMVAKRKERPQPTAMTSECHEHDAIRVV